MKPRFNIHYEHLRNLHVMQLGTSSRSAATSSLCVARVQRVLALVSSLHGIVKCDRTCPRLRSRILLARLDSSRMTSPDQRSHPGVSPVIFGPHPNADRASKGSCSSSGCKRTSTAESCSCAFPCMIERSFHSIGRASSSSDVDYFARPSIF